MGNNFGEGSKHSWLHRQGHKLVPYISETFCTTAFFYPRVALNIWMSVKNKLENCENKRWYHVI